MANLTAEQQYNSAVALIKEQLEAIQSKIEERGKKITFGSDILQESTVRGHYGHAADMLRVAHDLQDILEYLS